MFVVGMSQPERTEEMDLWLTVGEVAQHLRCCPTTVQRLARGGELKGFRRRDVRGSRWRFRQSDVIAFSTRGETPTGETMK
jgi:excisionase family DNA binding protein